VGHRGRRRTNEPGEGSWLMQAEERHGSRALVLGSVWPEIPVTRLGGWLVHMWLKLASGYRVREMLGQWLKTFHRVIFSHGLSSFLLCTMSYITAENGSRQPMFLIVTGFNLLLSTIAVLLRCASLLILSAVEHPLILLDCSVALRMFIMSASTTISWSQHG